MAELREIHPKDVPALVGLWLDVFGDPRSYVEEFFRLLPEIGSGVAVFEQNELLGAAYLLCGQSLVTGGRERRCGYLYAVAVQPQARGNGFGAALCRAAARLAEKNGCEILVTRPAAPGLFAWYERTLGLRCALRRETKTLDARPGVLPMEALSAEEYLARREALLSGMPHLRLSSASMQLEAANCAVNGGALYALGEGIAAVYLDDSAAEVRELLGASDDAACALGAALGARRVLLHRSSDEGAPYLAASQPLPAGTIWNLAFD